MISEGKSCLPPPISDDQRLALLLPQLPKSDLSPTKILQRMPDLTVLETLTIPGIPKPLGFSFWDNSSSGFGSNESSALKYIGFAPALICCRLSADLLKAIH